MEIGKLPGGKAAVTTRAEEFGQDGQKILTAMACNVTRVADWIDTAPRTRRRATHFRTLRTATA